MPLYIAANGAMPTTAELQPVATTTSLKTLLQIATPSTRGLRVVEWGISFDGSTAATPVRCELIVTDVAATVTAHVSAGVQPYTDPNAPASLVTLGTSATGYTASAEGTVAATRTGDVQQVAPTGQYVKMWPLGREFGVGASKWLRVRVKAAAAVNAYTYIVWEE
ncbi:hypothetical protein AB0L65_33150 [Nonomuraea sp. NPDC052116]|uniref:hypothetical protein n=1 Tax=Nonomuraea sp. NPDC052116 TaxID=3155665 RepID=UPI0034295BFB